jgi:hypothetical protein
MQGLGPKQKRITGSRLQPWNKMIRLAFCPVADLLAIYETAKDSWHTDIRGHSHFSKIFPFTAAEGDLLKE